MDDTDTSSTGKSHSSTEIVTHQSWHDTEDKNHASFKIEDNQNTRQISAASMPNRAVKHTMAIAQSIFMTGIKGSLNAPFIFY